MKAEFMIEAGRNGKTFLIFLARRKDSGYYRIVSFFEKKCQYKAEKRFWLYKAKHNHKTGETTVFYDRITQHGR